ncbi:MAG: BlaI/MecI/CopY family transcriptional regulator [Defluviitaleaceae bacterium]|nr:BlaI/MecI/CopY family transcriptional regulator [Defluviitaleaceae bacterium]MCL2264275.1 BlaI/MecI/CopY family transcriptional regulator [Defluviitaleaceae bacterium]
MRLTDKEMEIMAVLWSSDVALTATEIVKASENKTWKEASIYIIMTTLIKKGAVVVSSHKPTATNNARAYSPAMSSAECVVSYISSVRKAGVHIDLDEFVKLLRASEKKK